MQFLCQSSGDKKLLQLFISSQHFSTCQLCNESHDKTIFIYIQIKEKTSWMCHLLQNALKMYMINSAICIQSFYPPDQAVSTDASIYPLIFTYSFPFYLTNNSISVLFWLDLVKHCTFPVNNNEVRSVIFLTKVAARGLKRHWFDSR